MSIEFNKLKDVDSTPLFKEYANSCWEESSKSLIRKYNSIRIKRCGITASLRSEYSYEYQTICKDNARKFLIVNIENDSVIIPLKRVQMFKYIYNRLDGFPISLSDNRENEYLILKEISKNQLAKKIDVTEEESKLLIEWGFSNFEKRESCDYYSNIPNNFLIIDKNKWRTKKGINRMLKMPNLTFKVLKNEGALDYENVLKDKEDINKLNLGWEKYKKEINKIPKGWIRLEKSMAKYSYWNDNFTVCYLFKYKDIPVAYVVYIIIDNKVCYQIINKTVGRSLYDNINFLENEKLEFEEVRKRIPAFVHYITVKDMHQRGVLHGFFGGWSSSNGRVYKKSMNDSEVIRYMHELE